MYNINLKNATIQFDGNSLTLMNMRWKETILVNLDNESDRKDIDYLTVHFLTPKKIALPSIEKKIVVKCDGHKFEANGWISSISYKKYATDLYHAYAEITVNETQITFDKTEEKVTIEEEYLTEDDIFEMSIGGTIL